MLQGWQLIAKIVPNSTLQAGCPLAEGACQIFNIISSSDAKLANKILGRRF